MKQEKQGRKSKTFQTNDSSPNKNALRESNEKTSKILKENKSSKLQSNF